MAFSSYASSLPTVVEAKNQPNASKGIPREPGIPDSGQSATENDRLAFEGIIAVHNTYFIAFIGGLSVYCSIAGACWGSAFGTNYKTHAQVFLLSIPVIVGVALFRAMQSALSGCIARQKYLNELAVKLDINCSQDYLNGLVNNCSIDLSLLHNSVIISMYLIGILSVVSLILFVGRVIGTNRQGK